MFCIRHAQPFAACWDDLYNPVVMNFGVVRLHSMQESARRYHLFDDKDKLALVADYASPWLPADEPRRIWFAGADGAVMATLDLPEGEGRARNGRIHTSYALILDHAVYAIFNKYETEHDDSAAPYFIIEVEGVTWLAWNYPEDGDLFTLYDQGRTSVSIPPEPDERTPIGIIQRAHHQHDFSISLSVEQLRFAPLLLLALIFLIDQG